MTVVLRSMGGAWSDAGQPAQSAGEGLTAGGIARDDEDRVVAGDGAQDLGQRSTVECGSQQVGAAGWRAGHDEVEARLDAYEQVCGETRDARLDVVPKGSERRARKVAGDGVDGAVTGTAELDRPDLLQVARQRRLGDLYSVGREQPAELGLRAHGGGSQ